MNDLIVMFRVTLHAILRDRVLYALSGTALLLMVLVPFFSLFSMRQVQELSISLSLSSISLILFVFTVLLGASSLWRDVEKRYTATVLGLPISRWSFVLGKFLGIVTFLVLSAVLLGLVSSAVIQLAAAQYPAQIPINWLNLLLAMVCVTLKFILLGAFALLFSSLSTSFFLPVFGTIAVYLAGSATQQVKDYLLTPAGQAMPGVSKAAANALYYCLPNFDAFDYSVQAVYALPLPMQGVALACAYGLVYTGIVLWLAVVVFERRELV